MDLINDREFRIIVPKYDNSQRKIKPEEIESLALKVSNHFNGVTIFPSVLGCWAESDGIHCEENIILSTTRDSESTAHYDEQLKKDETFINDLAESLGRRFGQQAVMVSQKKVEVDFREGKYAKRIPPSRTGINFFNRLI